MNDTDPDIPPPVEDQCGYDPPTDVDTGTDNTPVQDQMWIRVLLTSFKAVAALLSVLLVLTVTYASIQFLTILLSMSPALALFTIATGILGFFFLAGSFLVALADATIPF